VLTDKMERRVRQMNLENQVTVLNKQVDVNKILAGVHASITLAATPGIVKSYPHSLLDSFPCRLGRPGGRIRGATRLRATSRKARFFTTGDDRLFPQNISTRT
jgi:hypothetical protein